MLLKGLILTLSNVLLLAASAAAGAAPQAGGTPGTPVARGGASSGLTAHRAARAQALRAAGPWTAARRLLGRQLAAPAVPGNSQAIRLSNGTIAILSSISAQVENGAELPSPYTGGTALSLKLVVPSTGLEEFFTLHVPQMQAGTVRPMVVAFHSFGRTHLEISGGTDLLDEAAARDWFLLAPVQRSAVGDALVNYGSVQSQEHVEAVMRWVLRSYGVDRSRVYGVGFSMGGGSAMSYAARHRDRREGAFAAVANHTGTVGLAHVYEEESTIRPQMELLFGGTPAQAPFEYQRSSVVELDNAGQVMSGGRHMAINLAFVHGRTYYASNDSLAYLQTQSQALQGFMQSLPFAFHQTLVVTAPLSCVNVSPGVPVGHCWESMNIVELFNWFSQKSLVETPPFGTVLADRDGRWNGFDLFQDAPGSFSSLDYEVDRLAGTLEISGMDNVRAVTFDLERNGFDLASQIDVTLGSTDGSGHFVSLRGVPSRPSRLLRDGVNAVELCVTGPTATWCYDQASETLTLLEPSDGQSQWTIIP